MVLAESGSQSLAEYFEKVAGSMQVVEASTFARQAKYGIVGIASILFLGSTLFFIHRYTSSARWICSWIAVCGNWLAEFWQKRSRKPTTPVHFERCSDAIQPTTVDPSIGVMREKDGSTSNEN